MITIEMLRQYRIGPFTYFDTLTAYLGTIVLYPIISWLLAKIKMHISAWNLLWWTLPIAVLTHLALGIRTPFMDMLITPPKSLVAWLVLLIMLFMGVRSLKRE